MTDPLYAAIDCGTNSTRLLISDGRTPAVRLMRITRLGQGVDRTGRLDPEAIERTLAVLREYRAEMDRHGVGTVRMAATSASRDAANRDEFLGAAEEILGARPELLSGDEEAAMSFAGATADLDPADGPFLVVDIGGGSTEFAVGASRLEGSISVDMGCVRMTEKYLQHDPPLPEELSNCLGGGGAAPGGRRAGAARRPPGRTASWAWPAPSPTWPRWSRAWRPTTRSGIHHFVLTNEAAEDVFRTLATESLEDRKHNPGLEAARADVIVGGLCVLVGVFRAFGFEECLVSEADILDGLVMSQLG